MFKEGYGRSKLFPLQNVITGFGWRDGEQIITVYCENMKHANIFCGQNAEFYYVTASDAYSNQLVFTG
jgi:hypothetical protein